MRAVNGMLESHDAQVIVMSETAGLGFKHVKYVEIRNKNGDN